MGSNFILGISSACYVQSMLYKIIFFMETLATSSNFLCLWHILFFFLSLFFVLLVYISSPSIPHPPHPFHHFYFILYIFSSSPLLLVCLSQADFSVALKKPYQFLVQFSFFVFNSASSFCCLSCLDFYFLCFCLFSLCCFCCWPMSVY